MVGTRTERFRGAHRRRRERPAGQAVRDAKISALEPPPIDNLGNSSGFSFRLQDRGQKGYAELVRAKDQLLAAAARSPILRDVYVEGLSPAPQVELIIDREQAAAFGVTFEDINNTISINLGSAYVNDFPNRGRMQRVILQGDRPSRMQADEILGYNVRNSRGQLVPLSSFATVNWAVGPAQIVGFNYYPSVRISGSAQARLHLGRRDPRDGAARRANCRAASATNGPASRCRRSSPARRRRCCSRLSVLLVFLVLAALYESWTIPLAVLLTVPLGILGAVIAAMRTRSAERRLFHGGAGDDHRPCGEGRHSHHRVREIAARAGQKPEGRDARGLPSALPADPDDRPRLLLRRRADGDRRRARAPRASRRSAPW